MADDKKPSWAKVHERCHAREQRLVGELLAARAERDHWRQEYHNRTMALRGQHKGMRRLERKARRWRRNYDELRAAYEALRVVISQMRDYMRKPTTLTTPPPPPPPLPSIPPEVPDARSEA